MSIAEVILSVCFWCSAAGVLYAYLGYPIVIAAFSRVFGSAEAPPALPDAALPSISLLIAAYNEAGVIEDRIKNALAREYPDGRYEVAIASDGSDDGTVEVCGQFKSQVRLFDFPQRRGKAATLNAAIQELTSDIIIFSDANTHMDPGAVRLLARWFADPSVGAVCGRLVLTDSSTGRNADGIYWRYETFLKRCEGRLGALLGANGAIYAIRKCLFVPLPSGTLVDDFVVPLAAKLKSGCRIIYEPSAIAHEETAPDLKGEFRRRSRIGGGGAQALSTLWPLLSPRFGWTAFAFWSHKVLRWACPVFLCVALLSAAALVRDPLYRMALIGQVAFYGLCAAAALLPPSGRVCRLLRVFPMFASMNMALLVGLLRSLRGNESGTWTRTLRAQDQRPVQRQQAA